MNVHTIKIVLAAVVIAGASGVSLERASALPAPDRGVESVAQQIPGVGQARLVCGPYRCWRQPGPDWRRPYARGWGDYGPGWRRGPGWGWRRHHFW